MKARFAIGLGILVIVVVGAAVTYSLWTVSGAQGAGPFRSGDLDITLIGDTQWQEMSEGEIDPSTFRAMPGDTFTIMQEFVTTLHGDNIAGDFTVRWADPAPDLPEGAGAAYTVLDDDGADVTEEAPLGEQVTVPHVPPGEHTWTVSIQLTFDDDEATPRYADPADEDPEPAPVGLGEIVLELGQARSATEEVP